MNVLWGALVLIVVTAITVSTMLFVRSRAPEGSSFTDGDRASGVFGVLATGFSVLLGFIIFLSFQSYDDSRSGAEDEATIVAQQVETAQFLPGETSPELTSELVCYARSVAGTEWSSLEEGKFGNGINPWGAAMFHTIKDADPKSATEQSAYDRWMDQTEAREQARIQRIHGAAGIIPIPLWLALYLITAVLFVYMLFFADRAEPVATQAMLMGSVTVMVTSLLLLLVFFDRPYGGFGKLQPTAMERTVRLINAELKIAALDLQPPCDADGNAR